MNHHVVPSVDKFGSVKTHSALLVPANCSINPLLICGNLILLWAGCLKKDSLRNISFNSWISMSVKHIIFEFDMWCSMYIYQPIFMIVFLLNNCLSSLLNLLSTWSYFSNYWHSLRFLWSTSPVSQNAGQATKWHVNTHIYQLWKIIVMFHLPVSRTLFHKWH